MLFNCTFRVDANSTSLFDDIPPAVGNSQPTGKRKVEDIENNESKRLKTATRCKTLNFKNSMYNIQRLQPQIKIMRDLDFLTEI